MNVLVYAGSEAHPKSLENTLSLLSSLSLPNYTIQPLSKASFIKEPWEIGCRLLVLPYLNPGSANSRAAGQSPLDLFGPQEVKRLRTFVEQDGGAVLGIGLGARVESASPRSLHDAMSQFNLNQERGIPDLREALTFKDQATNTLVCPETHGLTTNANIQPGVNPVEVSQATVVVADTAKGRDEDTTLGVCRPVHSGAVAFVRPTLVSLTDEDRGSLAPFLHNTITRLGLQLPPIGPSETQSVPTPTGPPRPLPQFLVSIPPPEGYPPHGLVSNIVNKLFPSSKGDASIKTIKDIADTFVFMPSGSKEAEEAVKGRGAATDDSRLVVVCRDGELPPPEKTPKFDLAHFFNCLRKGKGQTQLSRDGWDIGDVLFYGERVTSTQSLFDRNPQLLTSLPAPVLSIASQQISGRGRGKNVWLSPDGCLMFSVLLRIELDHGQPKSSSGGAYPTPASKTTSSKTGKTSVSSAKTSSSSTPSLKTGGTKTTVAGDTHAPVTFKAPLSPTSAAAGSASSSSSSNLKTSDIASTLKTSSSKTLKTTHSPSETRSRVTQASSTPTTPLARPLPRLPASRLVFVQYLFALAIVQACRHPDVLGPEMGKRVRLKWPNDIYLDTTEHGVGAQPKEEDWSRLKKIGGVIVNTNFGPEGKVDIVVGCGLNVSNDPPIVSLAQLKRRLTGGRDVGSLLVEETAAAIMTTADQFWTLFVEERGSFSSFNSQYLDTWLHQNQRVTLTTVTPHVPVKIVGITPDFGLLRTVPVQPAIGVSLGTVGLGTTSFSQKATKPFPRYVYPGGDQREYIDLQPDGNSFDLMAGLIKAKTY